MKKNSLKKAGFTLIELLISVSIFAFMTALLLGNYGNFSNSILVTNVAYDVALTVRQAQSFGLNVRQVGNNIVCTNGVITDGFQCSYGAHFDSTPAYRSQFKIFADSGAISNIFEATTTSVSPDYVVNTYSIKRGGYISSLCVGLTECAATPPITVDSVDVVYKRPNPNAIITANGSAAATYNYAEIRLRTPDGSTKKVVVRKSGQISIENN